MSDEILTKMSGYHLVFISLILAAAVTEILSSLGIYIRNHRHIAFSYIVAGWMFLSLLVIIQFWYALTGYYSSYTGYNTYFIDITSAIFYYLLSRLVFPDLSSYNFSKKIYRCCKKEEDNESEQLVVEKYSLDNYYYRNFVYFCSVAIILVLISIFKGVAYHSYFTDKSIVYGKTLFRAAFLTIIFIAFITSWYEKEFPDEIQAKKGEFEREFTGVAYKYNLLMTIIFTFTFLLFIFKYLEVF